jgi:hypothetical protein
MTLFALILVGLSVAWVAIEQVHDLRVTIFQPFRMATVVRGLALVAIAGRIVALARERHPTAWCRVALLMVGLTSDWSLVVATAAECAWALAGRYGVPAGCAVLCGGIAFLAVHDTHQGAVWLGVGLGVGCVAHWLFETLAARQFRPRLWRVAVFAWIVPVGTMVMSTVPAVRRHLSVAQVESLLSYCRFGETPVGDFERLAVWCRDHTPTSARFVGPPGAKGFRLWSERSLAFNQAGSPYHGKGLADWVVRYRDHIRFEGTTATLAHLYVHARRPLEMRYDAMNEAELAALATRQGAAYVVAPPGRIGSQESSASPLELLHVEGRYAVYRVRIVTVASAGTG